MRRRCFNFNLDSPRLHSHVVNVVLTRPLTHSELVYAANGATILECAACDEHRIDPARYPICIDSGASVSITPNPTDFVNGIHPTTLVDLKGLEGLTRVHGEGIVEWRIFDLFNTVRVIRTKAYFVPGVTIRLFSPQTYFKEGNSGSYYMSHDGSTLTLHDGTALVFPYNRDMNLPLMLPSIGESQANPCLTRLDLSVLAAIPGTESLAHSTVADETNQNITRAQKELLLWHWRFGHCGFQWVQSLAAIPRTTINGTVSDTKGTALLPTKNPGVSSCTAPLCAACQLAKQSRRGSDTSSELQDPSKHMSLRTNDLQPGDRVSIDQFVSTVGGRLQHTKGKEKRDAKYNGGTIFVDHASGFIYSECQVSLNAGETVVSKNAFERFAAEYGIVVKHYHADNHPFQAKDFQESLDHANQKITFSGVGAKHQNGVAERAVQTITKWARAMLLHATIHWPDSANLELWPFAIRHAIFIWNHLPKQGTRLSPLEIFTRSTVSNVPGLLSRMHVWGCPVYVLDPKIQDGKKLPKWSPRVRRGQFVGFSRQHSSSVGLILNLLTGNITAQFHCVYDDLFTTVPANGTEFETTEFDAESWNSLIQSGLERTLDDDESVEVPDLEPDWVETSAQTLPTDRLVPREPERHDLVEPTLIRTPTSSTPPAREPVHLRTPPALRPTSGSPPPTLEGTPRRHLSDEFDAESKTVKFKDVIEEAIDSVGRKEDQEEPQPAPTANDLPPPRRSMRERKTNSRFRGDEWANYQRGRVASQRVRASVLNEQFLHRLDWSTTVETCKSGDLRTMLALIRRYTNADSTVDWLHPFALAAKANSDDNPDWHTAMNGPDKEGYWNAMCKELETLTVQKDAWEVVDREQWMNVLPSTWAFKCKRYPDGLIKKLKARFCVRGDRQRAGVDYFETFAPVVSWTTVRLMLILSLILNLSTRQVDYTAAFLHADIDVDPNFDQLTDEEKRRSGVYVEMPRGFTTAGKVLKLKKSLYGLKQAPRNFFQHLKATLEKIGFVSTDSDACLFISEYVICLVYVDDTLLFSPQLEYIDAVLDKLRAAKMDLEVEDDVAGFLGVDVNRHGSSLTMTQTGLIDRVIKALGCDTLPIKRTPADYEPLGSDKDGESPQESFNYASVIGMLQYLQGHTRPDITFAVSQCARYIHNTRRSHEIALLRIGQYLRGTATEGLTMTPNSSLGLDCFVDADFAGLWGSDDPQDPITAKSRTGYVLCLSQCPILWISKLQTDIALSTMEAEYNALSMAMKDLLPLKRLIETVSEAVGLSLQGVINMRTTVWEDNTGALTLANLEPGRMTPRSKHYGVKYHWFRSHLKPNNIEVLKIDTDDQQADIFTKGLRTQKFVANRKQLLGWFAGNKPKRLRSEGSVTMYDSTALYSAYYKSPGLAWMKMHQK